MKNYFKKFSIVFLMALAIIGTGLFQHESIAKAATIGQQLTAPENGWKRYDDTAPYLQYTTPNRQIYSGAYMNTLSYTGNGDLTFKFKGTKIMIGTLKHIQHIGYQISIDGIKYPDVSTYSSSTEYQIVTFIKNDLTNDIHTVNIKNMSTGYFAIDFIDIDANGYLINSDESISLDTTTMNLMVNNSKQIAAITTPAGVGVTWSSSDTSIATVDSTGKVTAVKEGQATITATTTDGSNLSATCIINVTNPITTGISLNKISDSLTIGQTDNLVAITTPAAVQVTWSSSDSSIVMVDSTGKITAIKEGQVTITATTADGTTATCAVTVTNNTTPVDPTPTESEYIINTARAKGDNTNNASGEVSIIYKGIAEAQLSVVKTADVDSVYVGDNFTYTVLVSNTSDKVAKAVVIKDDAPNHINFIVNRITTTQGKIDPSSTAKNVVVNVGDIQPLGTVTIKIPSTVVM